MSKYFGSEKYNADLRIKDIESAIRDLQKDGLKVGLEDGKLYVENTVYTSKNGKKEPFGYATIDCFADETLDNHYVWLENNLHIFFENLNLSGYINNIPSIIACDADKCYGYKYMWENEGIPFFHGIAIYLISKIKPYSEEVRDTKNGWVNPEKWVIASYNRFKPHLPLM